ncbi:MAG: hypothetical protein HYU66_11910 [Armatimonadetes bacterium]|nr:hypothetical protein [Armatimonadota bacterium]
MDRTRARRMGGLAALLLVVACLTVGLAIRRCRSDPIDALTAPPGVRPLDSRDEGQLPPPGARP